MILSTNISRALKTFYSLEVNSPFLGEGIKHKISIATGKTQREHKGILHVPDLINVYQKAGPPLNVPLNSCKQLNEQETKTLLSTEGAVTLLCRNNHRSPSWCHQAVIYRIKRSLTNETWELHENFNARREEPPAIPPLWNRARNPPDCISEINIHLEHNSYCYLALTQHKTYIENHKQDN